MITKMALTNFKSFQSAKMKFGSLNTLIGTNAAGKSNIRDAFRILHGVSRGYTLSEAIGGKYGEGGIVQWSGVRGGTKEIMYQDEQANYFDIHITFTTNTIPKDHSIQPASIQGEYYLKIGFDDKKLRAPKVLSESLRVKEFVYNSGWLLWPINESNPKIANDIILAECASPRSAGKHKRYQFRNDIPILTQCLEYEDIDEYSKMYVRGLVQLLRNMRFLDVEPEAMRQPSLPGQKQLSDRGENLSSVLLSICSENYQKSVLLEWLKELTPYEVSDLQFSEDFQGKIIFYLVEPNGRKISAYSASDGTLRYLGFLAALLSSEKSMFYFLEEIENGVHPSRLRILIALLEQRSMKANIQLIMSTHSPLILGYLSNQSRKNVSLVYRLPEKLSSNMIAIEKISGFNEVMETQNIADIHASSWFETIMELISSNEE